RHADHVVDLDLAAGADAQIALDAGVEIDRHGDVAAVGRRHRRRLALGEAAVLELLPLDDLPQLGVRIVRDLDGGLVGEPELGHHLARRLGAVGLGLDLHAGRRRADAARREHALALDLDHADAAVAVRAIAGLGRVAQMRQLDVEPARRAEDRLARADVDLAIVDEEGLRVLDVGLAGARDLVGRDGVRDPGLAAADRRSARRTFFIVAVTGRLPGVVHRQILSITNGPTAWRARWENISARRPVGSRPPGRVRRWKRRA